MNERVVWIVAVLMMLLGLVLASLGAHGPLAPTDWRASRSFDIAVQVHWVHALALMGFVLYQRGVATIGAGQRAGFAALMVIGVGLFSGTIYLDVLFGVSAVSGLTPIGGLLLFFFWGYWLWLLRG